MTERGARHFVYLSRSGAADPEVIKFLDDLHALGVSTQVFKCDIVSKSDVTAAIR